MAILFTPAGELQLQIAGSEHRQPVLHDHGSDYDHAEQVAEEGDLEAVQSLLAKILDHGVHHAEAHGGNHHQTRACKCGGEFHRGEIASAGTNLNA